MSVSQLSASSQTYLKAIWTLGEWSQAPATLSSLAAKVGVRPSTASEAVRKLTDQGLIEHAPYGAITLTAQGREHAVAMVRRHRLIETFLVRTLDYRWDQVHQEAQALEHAVSDFMIDRMDEHLARPTRDPHGDPIPRSDGTVDMPDATSLSQVEPGAKVQVERISDADAGLLRFLAERGIGIGTLLLVSAGEPYSDALVVTVDGQNKTVALGAAAAASVWVSVPRDATAGQSWTLRRRDPDGDNRGSTPSAPSTAGAAAAAGIRRGS